jgi:6-phosphofructokinase 1
MDRIAVLTSGGDNPGLNPCIRAVVRMGIHLDLEVMGIHRGYAGLMGGEIRELDARAVGGILGRGGTILGTARAPEFCDVQGRRKALRMLNRFDIDGLVVIGGNGSLTGALELHRMGFPVVGIPSTIDNDINGTDIAVGVDTALNTILDAIDKIKDTASSHNRAFLIETIEDSYIRGKAHCIIVVAEGWKPGTDEVAQKLRERKEALGFSVRVTRLGHVQRGGSPMAFDRILATRMGAAAVRELASGNSGIMVGWIENEAKPTPLEEAIAYQKEVDPELYELAQIMDK